MSLIPPVPTPVNLQEGGAQTARDDGQSGKGGAQTIDGGTERSNIKGNQAHPPIESARYNLRNRADLANKTSFNEYFDNPASQQSYSPHLQFFQKSVNGMIEDPQKLHDHLCDLYEKVVDFVLIKCRQKRE